MNIILSSIALVLLAATTVSGQPAPPKIDVTKLGPQVGETDRRFPAAGSERKGMDPGFADGPEWLDARLLAVRRLVTVLQNAAR